MRSANLRTVRQERAMSISLIGADFLVERVAEEFVSRIFAANRKFSTCADLLSFSGKLANAIGELPNVENVVRYENSRICERITVHQENSILPIGKDGNIFREKADLVISAYGLHWADDIGAMIARIRTSMSPDGLFLGALPARGTLAELQDCLTCAELELSNGAGLHIDQFTDIQLAGNYLQDAGFALPVIDVDEVVVRYDNMFDLIKDLRAMGATVYSPNGGSNFTNRNLFKRANELYREKYSDKDGRIRATFGTIYLTGWVPHESQQKPAKPGSANVSLADFLK